MVLESYLYIYNTLLKILKFLGAITNTDTNYMLVLTIATTRCVHEVYTLWDLYSETYILIFTIALKGSLLKTIKIIKNKLPRSQYTRSGWLVKGAKKFILG